MDQERAMKASCASMTVPGTGGRFWYESNSELEAEHDGREPDHDAEPDEAGG